MRPTLAESFIQSQCVFLSKVLNVPITDEMRARVSGIAKDKFQERKLKVQHTISPGNIEVETIGAKKLLDSQRGNVLAPSGSIYLPSDKHASALGMMSAEQDAERSLQKKLMLKAKDAGNTLAAMIHFQIQSLIKIVMNSMPGGFAFSKNLFYDRGGYNSITSLARSLIAVGYTITEQILSGVFGIFDEEDLINYITLTLKHLPDPNKINNVMKQFELKYPTKQEVWNFFFNTVQQYNRKKLDMPIAKAMFANLTQEELTFLFYASNLKHILIHNNDVASAWVLECINPKDHIPNETEVDVKTFDDDLIVAGALLAKHTLNNKGYRDVCYNPEQPEHNAFVQEMRKIQICLEKWAPVFDVFIYHNMGIPGLNKNKKCVREAVIISDTDSVIYTVKRWVEWIMGTVLCPEEGMRISALMIYILSKILSHEMYKFSLQHGVAKDRLHLLKMKNEYLYLSMLLFDVKKHYAGIVAIQEGVVLQKTEVDIKGVGLRGSSVAKQSIDFFEKTATQLLLDTHEGKISAIVLVTKIVEYELKMIKSLKAGELDYLTITSLRMKSDYTKPLSDRYYYYLAWADIYSQKYGAINLPNKVPVVKLLAPSQGYYEWLEQKDPAMRKRWEMFMNTYKRYPPQIAVNPSLDRLPEELTKLINIREIVHSNVRALYLTLEALGIGLGHNTQMLLLSEVYGNELTV